MFMANAKYDCFSQRVCQRDRYAKETAYRLSCFVQPSFIEWLSIIYYLLAHAFTIADTIASRIFPWMGVGFCV
jgi:hypothetical protein